MQINFHQVGGDRLYLWYPVILISISVALLFNPIRVFYFRTRMWLLYSLVGKLDVLVYARLTEFSGVCFLLAHILSSGEISIWETCSVPLPTAWV
jgi:hypothetical protein